jgi:polyisoprenoid-binding protein YceI
MFSDLVRSHTLSALMFATAFACSKAPANDKPAAQIAEAVVAKADVPASANAYAFSSPSSRLTFVGSKVTGSQSGSFTDFKGTIRVDPAALETGSVEVEIKMDSLSTEIPKLSEHLKSPDFFDVAQFPTAKFTSTSVSVGSSAGGTHTVTGNLTLHGVTKSISFPATLKASSDSVTVDAEFSINRQAFGVTYPGMPDDLIQDQLLIKLQIAANKA